MDHDLEVFPDPAAMPARAAGYVVGLASAAVAAGSRFSFAVSAGHSLVLAYAQAAERVRGVALAHRDGDQG